MSPERNIEEAGENNTGTGEDIKGYEIRSGKHFAQEHNQCFAKVN